MSARAAGAAAFSLVTETGEIASGERFSVNIWIDPNGEALDTVRAYLTFPADRVQVRDMTLGSLFPRVSPGNGFDNEIGMASIGAFAIDSAVRERGVLATVVFEAMKSGTANIAVNSTSRLISNGEEKANASGHVGTSIEIGSGSGTITPVADSGSQDSDVTPPNAIVPFTARTRYVEGEDALIDFGTTDDGSGIDHYELSLNDEPFFVAESPYLLSGLTVGDLLIEVRAVDRAGNERFGKTGIRVYQDGTELKPEDETARALEQERIREIVAAESSSPDNGLLALFVSASLVILAIMASIFYRKRRSVS